MAKTLITGASGFIGNHVTRLCLERGDDVRVMVMPGEDRSPFIGLDVEFVEGNLLDSDSLKKAVQGVNQLYHMAALFALWTKDPDLHYKINVEGTRAILTEAKRSSIEKVVFTSSVAAIGVACQGELSNEETPFNCWPWASEYILSKYISHLLVKSMVADGLPATMVMPALPFGPGDRAPTPTGTLLLKTLKGEMKNYWDGGISPIDVRDVAMGHVLAMDMGRIGESYLLGNTSSNMTSKEFLTLIASVSGVPDVATREVSQRTMLTVARLAEAWSKISRRAPFTTYKNTLFAMQHCYVDSSKAVQELGLPQTPIETAVADATDWFRENGYV